MIPTPVGLGAVGSAYIDHVQLAWQPSHGAIGYLVEWSGDGSEWFAIDEAADAGYTETWPVD